MSYLRNYNRKRARERLAEWVQTKLEGSVHLLYATEATPQKFALVHPEGCAGATGGTCGIAEHLDEFGGTWLIYGAQPIDNNSVTPGWYTVGPVLAMNLVPGVLPDIDVYYDVDLIVSLEVVHAVADCFTDAMFEDPDYAAIGRCVTNVWPSCSDETTCGHPCLLGTKGDEDETQSEALHDGPHTAGERPASTPPPQE